jgi:hypothetical protein
MRTYPVTGHTDDVRPHTTAPPRTTSTTVMCATATAAAVMPGTLAAPVTATC